MRAESSNSSTASPRGLVHSSVRVLAFVLLLVAAAAAEAHRLSSLLDVNVWLHLRTGLWIVANHSVPRSGLFSQYRELPWATSSWGYEVVLALFYKFLGLRGIPALMMLLRAVLAVVTFFLARGWRGNFWIAVVLSALAQYVFGVLSSDPLLFTICFFGLELILLFESRRSGDVRQLFWLPPLFLCWANLHIEFVDGLILLGIFLLSICVENALRALLVNQGGEQEEISLASAGTVAGISVLATLLTPYGYRQFECIFTDAYSGSAFRYVADMHAMGFRRPQDYVLVLLVMGAFLALGRRRSRDVFKLGLLTVGTLVAFRMQHDSWCAVLPATAILADEMCSRNEETERKHRNWECFSAAALGCVILVVTAARVPDQSELMNRVSSRFPVKACDFIRENQLPPPLFNTYAWGGFLTWYLPEYPVAIDGRFSLYGEERVAQYFNLMTGGVRLEDDSSFSGARTLLLERDSGLTKALTELPNLRSQYRILFSDEISVVLQPLR
jgi:hypothetical protein